MIWHRIVLWLVVLTLFTAVVCVCAAEEWRNFIYTGDITSICATGATIWVGTKGGVVGLDKESGALRHFTRADGLVRPSIWHLATDPDCLGGDGSVWAATQYGLAQFVGGGFMSFPSFVHGVQDSCVPRGFAIDHDGAKWLATSDGALCFDGESWRTFDPSNSPLLTKNLQAVAVDRQNNKWFSTQETSTESAKGVFRFDGQTWENFTTENSGLAGNYVTAIGADAQDAVWFAARNEAGFGSASRLFEGNWTTFDNVPAGVEKILMDAVGSVWFVRSNSLLCFDGASWITYNYQNTPLPMTGIASLCFDGDGDPWVGMDGGSILTYDGSGMRSLDITLEGPAALDIATLAAIPPGGPLGALFCMTYKESSAGVTVYDFISNSWSTLNSENCPIASFVDSVAIDLDGTVFIGTGYGVYSYDGGIWGDFTVDPDTLPYPWWNRIYRIGVDSQNVKWLSHAEALEEDGTHHLLITSYDGTLWQSFDLAQYPQMPGAFWCRCFAEGPDGGRWFGYQSLGLAYISRDMSAQFVFTKDNSPLPWASVNAIWFDQDGQIWAAGSDGTSQSQKSLLHFDGEELKTLTTENVGLPSNEINFITRDLNGEYWFATSRGVSVFDGEGWITLDTDNSPITSRNARSIAFDFMGNRWMATSQGLSVLMAGPLSNHYPRDPRASALWRTALPNDALNLTAEASDPDLDPLEFRFMGPDGFTSEWSTEALQISFATAGTYRLQASAKDSRKAVSRWSAPLEVAVMEQYSPFVSVSSTRESYRPGQTLSAAVYLENRGATRSVDAYLGILLPDGTELYYPDFGSVRTTFELTLTTGSRLGPLVFYEGEVTGAFARGEYTLFAVLLDPTTGQTVYESRAGFRVSIN